MLPYPVPQDTANISLKKYIIREIVYVSCVEKNRGVQNRTNPKEKPQTEPIQTETQKTAYGSDVFKSFFSSTAWFGSVWGFDFINRIKPSQTAIQEIQWKL